MKFYHRLIFALVLVVTCFVCYLMYGPGALLVPQERRRIFAANVFNLSKITEKISNDIECHLAARTGVTSNISTWNLYNELDLEYISEETELTLKLKKKHVDQYLEPLKIFVIPHSHNDPGWLQTFEGYFNKQTRSILDNMVDRLQRYKNMTFVWSETSFLSLWWPNLEDEQKEAVIQLIKDGRLEILHGGWVVPDEASTHYSSLIDTMIEGHQWLENHLGVKPVNSWSLDPFGYSGTMPYILKQSGFENMVILRVHASVKSYLRDKKQLEFQWRQSWDQHGDHDMFCHMVPYKLYAIKHSCGPSTYVCQLFDFLQSGNYREVMPKFITPDNIAIQSETLLEQYRYRSQHFPHNIMFVPLGDDFRFDTGMEWDTQYTNYQKIFQYMNSREDWRVQIQFGTLGDYFKALKTMVDVKQSPMFPTLSGDFYPYSDQNDEYWTGYFSTRMYDKVLERKLHSLLRTAEILTTFAIQRSVQNNSNFTLLEESLKYLTEAHQSLALFQHHDAITGTSKPNVVVDYEERMLMSLNGVHHTMTSAAEFLLSGVNFKTQNLVATNFRDFMSELSLNTDLGVLDLLQKAKVVDVYNGRKDVALFNSLPQRRKEVIRLHVSFPDVAIWNTENELIPCQLNPVWVNNRQLSRNKYELVFVADLLPLTITTYYITRTKLSQELPSVADVDVYNSNKNFTTSVFRVRKRGFFSSNIILQNDYLEANFSSHTGYLNFITLKENGAKIKMNMQLMYYNARGSGAYIFNPGNNAIPLFKERRMKAVLHVVKGRLVSEVHIVHEFIKQVVRIYHVPVDQASGMEILNYNDLTSKEFWDKEIVMRLETGIENGNLFFTDQNGFQIIQRKIVKNLDIPGNYYPMTTTTFIQDKSYRVSLLSAQSHGTSSLESGWLEVMMDRNLLSDDNRGLGEGVNDNKATVMKFFLLVEKATKNNSNLSQVEFPSLTSQILVTKLNNPVIDFIVQDRSLLKWRTFEPLKYSFPCDLDLVQLRSLTKNNGKKLVYNGTGIIIHRRSYSCQYQATNVKCKTSHNQFNLDSYFNGWNPTEFREMSLSFMHSKGNLEFNENLKIKPMEIGAYFVKL